MIGLREVVFFHSRFCYIIAHPSTIIVHSVCIFSISVDDRLSRNNRQVDTPPTSIKTKFCL